MKYLIQISKSKKELNVLNEGSVIKSFYCGIGKNDRGHKQLEGDMKTPEGEYLVCAKNSKSKYHLSLALNYPNNIDATLALSDNRITVSEYNAICTANDEQRIPPWDTTIGGAIYIHGELEKRNWSEGCIRLNKVDIEWLFENIQHWTPVVIEP